MDHCQHLRRTNSIGINQIAADTWRTIYPNLLALQVAGKDDGLIQHQHTVAGLLKAIDGIRRGLWPVVPRCETVHGTNNKGPARSSWARRSTWVFGIHT